MFEKLKERYQKYYIRDDQLDRYVALGVITEEQADEIKGLVENPSGGGGTDRALTILLHSGQAVTILPWGGAAHGDH